MYIDQQPANQRELFVLPIKTVFADRIRNGEKHFELRSYMPNVPPGSVVALYETTPAKHVQTLFFAGRTFKLTPDEAWETLEDRMGVEFDYFFDYFRSKPFCYGIEILRTHCTDPLSLATLSKECNFAPPQMVRRWREPIHHRIQSAQLHLINNF